VIDGCLAPARFSGFRRNVRVVQANCEALRRQTQNAEQPDYFWTLPNAQPKFATERISRSFSPVVTPIEGRYWIC
jgi:hypothetical protein